VDGSPSEDDLAGRCSGTASSSGEYRTPEELSKVVDLAALVEDEDQGSTSAEPG
jgi:hypothetical protein